MSLMEKQCKQEALNNVMAFILEKNSLVCYPVKPTQRLISLYFPPSKHAVITMTNQINIPSRLRWSGCASVH